MVRIHPDPPVRQQQSPGQRRSGFPVLRFAIRGCSSVGRAPALQAGGRRFDPVQLHQPKARDHTQDAYPKRLASGFWPVAFRSKNRLLFNNSEGKAFMKLDESFMDKKG